MTPLTLKNRSSRSFELSCLPDISRFFRVYFCLCQERQNKAWTIFLVSSILHECNNLKNKMKLNHRITDNLLWDPEQMPCFSCVLLPLLSAVTPKRDATEHCHIICSSYPQAQGPKQGPTDTNISRGAAVMAPFSSDPSALVKMQVPGLRFY